MIKIAAISLLALTALGWASLRAVEARARERLTAPGRIALLREASSELGALGRQRLPSELTGDDVRRAQAFVDWLTDSSEQFELLADRWERARLAASDIRSIDETFEMQYLQLQQAIEKDIEQFQMMTQIMKSKHETAKAAINNVR